MRSGTITWVVFLSIPALFIIFNIVKDHAYTGSARNAGEMDIIEPFGGPENYNRDIRPFYKWTDVLVRMEGEAKYYQPWLENRKVLKSMSYQDMAAEINTIINRYDYIADSVNWGKSDYWATPAEFFEKGGDCEDFVIAKYAWLRSLGVPEDLLRLAVVHDRIQGTPHAVLLAHINDKVVILDNQVQEMRDSASNNRYRLIYSINRNGWWHPEKANEFSFAVREDMESVSPASGSSKEIEFSEECLKEEVPRSCINAIEPNAG